MEIVSLIGIAAGLVLFIFCCAKGVNLVVSGFLGALVIIVTSGNPILEGITSTWAAGFSCPAGSKNPGRLSPRVSAAALPLFWAYLRPVLWEPA